MVKSKGKERKGKMRWFLKVGSHRQRHLYRSCALQLQVPTLLHQPRSFSFDVAEREGFDIFTASKPSFIHPTAIVPPDAVIGQGVSIGPFCSVSTSAKLGNGCQLHPGSHVFGTTELGDNCMLMTGAVVGDDYPGCTIIGSNNRIGYHAVVGVKCQDMKYKPEDECFLEVGHNNDIREHTSIHRSSKSTDRTVIGNGNLIMGSCHIAHDCKIGNNNIFANNTLLAGHVEVEVQLLFTNFVILALSLFLVVVQWCTTTMSCSYIVINEGFARCPKVHVGSWRKSRASWSKFSGPYSMWIQRCRDQEPESSLSKNFHVY